MTKTKAQIAQEIFDFNSQSIESRTKVKPATDGVYGQASTSIVFKHSDDPEVMAIYDDLCFEQRERERQRTVRLRNLIVMAAIISSSDKTFGMQEIVER